MKNKKILGGLVVVAVLLSGTTVLYFAGVERAGVTPALADQHEIGGGGGGEGSDCTDAGGFCAKDLGTDGGCNFRPCCPEGQTYCGSDHRYPISFQEIGSPQPPSLGSCWKYDGSTAPWCLLNQCRSPAFVCPSLECVVIDSGTSQRRSRVVSLNASCLPAM